ncbi:acyl-CoA thioesterase [Barrientosiimonas humi]|uniref:acyl-CoA thioesterase n=1 Tax=Barrientosiimonas humi TaxID=999931 RepID=UPI001F2AB101|nr:acyl-CoA thioesterase II [Barrientosiimonas humi]
MSPDTPLPEGDPVADLLDVLDLQEAGQSTITVESAPGEDNPVDLGSDHVDIFVGRSQPQPHGRVFGGQVLAQCVVAAGRTVEGLQDGTGSRHVHSLHGYFLRAGDSMQPIRFAVERMRDGRSFSARRVHALQNGKVIMSMILSFQEAAGGLDHQAAMPAAPDPERLPTVAQEIGDIDHPVARHWAYRRAVDVRHVENSIYLAPGQQAAANQNVWLKVRDQMPDDPLLHAAALAYASDYTLLEAVLRRHRMAWSDPRLRAASLDHAMWFHRPVRVDDWVLYQQESPSASGGRGLGIGKMFASDGTLVATVAQEGMLRVKDS